MAIVAKLKEFLEEKGIPYQKLTHSTAYTAQEIAAAAHIPGKEMAKTVLVRKGPDLVMVVMPAPAKLDLEALKEEWGEVEVRLASEDEFMDRFPDCELGAMPPFGNLYGMPVYVDDSLREDEEIAFNAGNHHEVIRISYADFERTVQPQHLKTSTHSSG